MPNLPRLIQPRLAEYLASFPAVLVTGPRQAGKSTLLQMQLPQASLIDLDDVRTSAEVSVDPYLALALRKRPLIVDEVQAYPEILKVIKVLIDQERHLRGTYALTGSQVFPLMAGVTESLAGRVGILELLPMAWKEYGQGFPTEQEVLGLMLRGGYPSLAVDPACDREAWLNSYLNSYVERDIRALQAVQDLVRFRIFLKLLAGRVGELLNLHSLASDAGISVNTAKDWISLLETTYVVFRLTPWHRNQNKRLVKMPKIYFWDTGLLTFLAGIDGPERLGSDRQIGHIFENFVITELRKQATALSPRHECFFYRTHDGGEVDLLLQSAQGWHAIEIKWGSHTAADEVRTLVELTLDQPLVSKVVLCPSRTTRVVAANVLQRHWAEIDFGGEPN
ncbi:MAG: ATP-binding protein [Chlamydiia bacterium]